MRSSLLPLAIIAGSVVAACEDGPKQTYMAPSPGVAAYWNNGNNPSLQADGGLAGAPASATNATQGFGPGGASLTNGSSANGGGSTSVNILTQSQLNARWSTPGTGMSYAAIRPPNVAAGLDLAGYVPNPSTPKVAPQLTAPWVPGDVETWKGLTYFQAEYINGQGIPYGSYFGGSNEYAITWGENDEVVFDSYVSNHLGFYLGLNLGYLGEMDAKFKDPATGMTTYYKLTVDGIPIQQSTDGVNFTVLDVATGGLDWNDAAAGANNPATGQPAIIPFDLYYRAIQQTYSHFQAEAEGITCNQTNACQIITFPGGDIYPGGPSAPGAVMFIPELNWAFWVQPYNTPNSAATAVRIDFNLDQVMNFSNLYPVLKMDAQGPTSQTAVLGMATNACELALGTNVDTGVTGLAYSSFLSNCVQTDGDPGDNAGELNKLFTSISHDQESYFFNIAGIDVSFSAGNTLPTGQVATDFLPDGGCPNNTCAPQPTNPATEYNVDQNTLAGLANDWTYSTSAPPMQNLQGAGALYYQYKQQAITTIYTESGLTLPAGGVDALIASCIAPRDPTTGALLPFPVPANQPDGGPGTGYFDPNAFLAYTQSIGCTGIEGLLTTLTTTNDDPTNLGPGLINLPGASAYSLGMKPGTQIGMFCLDAASNNTLALPQATPPQYCNAGALLPTSEQQVVAVLGHGVAANLADDLQDNRFFFKMYGSAMIQVLEQTTGTGALASQPQTWGLGGPGSVAPISQDDLYFDGIGAGQFDEMEYVDRRFVCSDGSADCCPSVAALEAHSCCPNQEANCNPNIVAQPPLDLTFSADVKDGIMSAYDIWKYLYRGETALYASIDDPGYALASESNALLSNIFGSPALTAAFAGGAASVEGQGLVDIDFATIQFQNYQNAWITTPTALTLSYGGAGPTSSPISISSYYPSNPANLADGSIATQALINVPTSTGATTKELVDYGPNEATNGFYIGTPGNSTIDQWVQSAYIDFTGITITATVDITVNPSTTPPTVSELAVESDNFLGDVFVCYVPGATYQGVLSQPVPMPLLAVRMYSSVQKVMTWLNENPSAYTTCGIIVRWSSADNYIDLIESTSNGVRLDVTNGGGLGRIVGAELYVPGQAAEQ